MSDVKKEFQRALCEFATKIATKFKTLNIVEGQPEAQIVSPVETLLLAAQPFAKDKISLTNESATAEIRGRPDFAMSTGGLLQGYIELKAPGKGAKPTKFTNPSDKAQWAKFKKLPNILYTDGTEWVLYQEGSDLPIATLALGTDITIQGAKAVTAENTEALITILSRFFAWDPIVPKSPKDLAVSLAKLCHFLREDVETAVGDANSNLSEIMREWRARLFPDADDKRFADAYAQTVAYALLLARSRGLNTPEINKAVELLESAHGLLGQALNVLTQPGAISEVRPAVDMLFRYILAVDLSIFAKMPGEPWLYFYEDFLAEYDPALRKDFGVYYTPTQVVQAQTKLVSSLLQDRFNRKLGFADDGVSVLDPGLGTATYLLSVIAQGVRSAEKHGGKGYIPERVTMMARNTYGFEWLVGPYAVAHLRVSEELAHHGATLPADGVHVYLTDTLESPNATLATLPGLFGKKLSDEHKRALAVKSKVPILICIGNPPYDRHDASTAEQRGGWIRGGDGQKDEKPPLRSFIEPVLKAGRGGDLKNLYNSYVYFWRWALWKVFEQGDGPGVVSFITASSYLRGPAFLGMREQMRRTFDELWIIDLGGDNLGPRKTENVFAIQTPVAIAIGARYGKPNPNTPAVIHYNSMIDGTRQEKLDRLASINSFSDITWEPAMTGWQNAFLPQRSGDYWSWPLLNDLFPWQHSGVQMKRTWVIAPSSDSLAQRWAILIKAGISERKQLFIETDFRHIASSLKDTAGSALTPINSLTGSSSIPEPVRYGFRSFDRQWILGDNRLGDRLRPALWLVHGPKQVYLTSLLSGVLGTGPAATVTALIPDLHHFNGRGGKDIIPLWRNSSANQPNITKGLLNALTDVIGAIISPEDLFSYCYAVLNAPSYANRFSEDLVVPGLRIPVTKNAPLFAHGIKYGKRLIALHTFGERFIPTSIPQGKARIEKAITPSPMPNRFEYIVSKETLLVGSGEVRPVPKSVWEFSVSGYQVVQHWLDYRMAKGAGRQISALDGIRPTSWPSEWTTELLELIWILEATVDLQPKLDLLLDDIVKNPCFESPELPTPTGSEKQEPNVATTSTVQNSLFTSTELEP